MRGKNNIKRNEINLAPNEGLKGQLSEERDEYFPWLRWAQTLGCRHRQQKKTEMRTLTLKREGHRGRGYMKGLLKGGAEGPQTMRIIIVDVDNTTTHLTSHVEEGIVWVTAHCSAVLTFWVDCNGQLMLLFHIVYLYQCIKRISS